MQIRTRVLASAALAVAATVCCAVLLGIGASRSIAGDAEQEQVRVTSRVIVDLVVLTNEYTLHSESLVAEQWRQQHAALTATLSAPVQSGETGAARLALRTSASELPALFRRLTELNVEPAGPLTERSRYLLVDQLLSRTQALADAAYRWSREAADAEQAARRWLRIGGAAALLLLLGTTLAQPVVVWRRVLRPLSVLEKAAAAVERGDLTARCGSTVRDELGHVSRRFDAMSAALGQRSAQLYRSEQRLRAIADNLPVLIAYIDREHRYQFCNATFEKWFGIPASRLEGQLVREAMGEDFYAPRLPFIERALAGERVEFDQLLQHGDGPRELHALYMPHRENGVTLGLYALVTDVTEIRRNEAELTQLARFDPLTGLPNRRQFDERLAEAMARARRNRHPIAVLFLDIDHFKTVNDSLGHAAGDAVLKEFARRLVDTVRMTDTVARFAGDEFVIIVDAAAEETKQVARKIVLAVRQDFPVDGKMRKVTTSIGVALFDGDATTPGELMARADTALYAAKTAGRDGYCVAPSVRPTAPAI